MLAIDYLMGTRIEHFFINNEPNKALRNLKWNGLYLESFKGHVIKEQGTMVGPRILFMAPFG
jgi:hypothetical protein